MPIHTFQRLGGYRRPIGYSMNTGGTKAVLTTGVESMTSTANTKERLKNGESEKGA